MKRKLEKENSYERYKKGLFLEYVNSKKDSVVTTNERDNLEAIFTVFASNISRILDYLSETELAELYSKLTTDRDQNFYDWMHSKYDNLCETRNSIAGEVFLSSALVLRDFYKGNLKNINKGGDYLAALSQSFFITLILE